MEYKVLEENDLKLMESVLKEDNMLFNMSFLESFIDNKDSYGFIAKEEDIVIGFAYGYSLLRPDGRKMFYLHSIGVLSSYQNNGYGTNLLKFAKDFSKELGCYKMFLITNKKNSNACYMYEKLGGKNNYKDEIVYVFEE